MANVRPRRSKFTRVDDENEEPELINPVRNETTSNSNFFNDYDQMHSSTFRNGNGGKPEQNVPDKVKDASGRDLESLVRTLASLQFTTKGKIDSDGKVEIIFCSPEPIVIEEKPKPEVRFVENEPEIRVKTQHKHKHRRSNRRFLM